MRSRTLHYLGATLAVLILIAVIGSFVDQNVSAKVPVFEQASQCAETPTGTLTAPPLISVVGASFTAGVGPDNPSSNWAVRLAELLGWRGKTFGVPSVGYVNPGQDRLGPLDRLVSDLELASSHPKVVIVQAGHNDWRVPGTIERGRVEALVGLIEREDPGARLVFLTGFATLHSDRVNKRVSYTNDAIVEAIRSIDPKAIVIDPFSWRFQRSSDGLHPTALGDLQIAERVDGVLKADSVVTGATKPTAVDVSCKSLGKPRAFEEHLHGLGHRGPEPGPRWDSSQMTNDRATDTVTREAT